MLSGRALASNLNLDEHPGTVLRELDDRTKKKITKHTDMCKSRLPPAAWRAILGDRTFLFEQKTRTLHWKHAGRFAQEVNPDIEFVEEVEEEYEFERYAGIYNHSSKKLLMQQRGDPTALLVTNFVVALHDNPDNTHLRVQLARIKKIHRDRGTISVVWWTSNAQTLQAAIWRCYPTRNSQYAGTAEISVETVLVTFRATTNEGRIPVRFRDAVKYKLRKKDEGVLEWNRVVDQDAVVAAIRVETDQTNIEEYEDCLPASARSRRPVSARSLRLSFYPERVSVDSVSKSSDGEDSAIGDSADDNESVSKSAMSVVTDGDDSAIGSGSDDDEWKPTNHKGDVIYYEDAFVKDALAETNDGRTRSGGIRSTEASSPRRTKRHRSVKKKPANHNGDVVNYGEAFLRSAQNLPRTRSKKKQ